jgi:hypothetical protein
MKAEVTLEVGRLYWKQIRTTLDKIKIEYPDFAYIEGPGFIEKVFVLHGEYTLLKTILDTLPKQNN